MKNCSNVKNLKYNYFYFNWGFYFIYKNEIFFKYLPIQDDYVTSLILNSHDKVISNEISDHYEISSLRYIKHRVVRFKTINESYWEKDTDDLDFKKIIVNENYENGFFFERIIKNPRIINYYKTEFLCFIVCDTALCCEGDYLKKHCLYDVVINHNNDNITIDSPIHDSVIAVLIALKKWELASEWDHDYRNTFELVMTYGSFKINIGGMSVFDVLNHIAINDIGKFSIILSSNKSGFDFDELRSVIDYFESSKRYDRELLNKILDS